MISELIQQLIIQHREIAKRLEELLYLDLPLENKTTKTKELVITIKSHIDRESVLFEKRDGEIFRKMITIRKAVICFCDMILESDPSSIQWRNQLSVLLRLALYLMSEEERQFLISSRTAAVSTAKRAS